MITPREKRIVNSAKDRLAIMSNCRRLAVHQLGRANHLASKRLSDGLVAQTHTQQGYLPREARDHIQSYSGIVRRSWTRRNDDSLRSQTVFNLVNRDVIVPTHFNRLTKLAEILDEVVSKRIVVVDY